MANQNKFFTSKPWFRKKNPNANVDNPTFTDVHYFNYSSVAGYLGFKFYFPLAGKLQKGHIIGICLKSFVGEGEIQKIVKKTTAFENYISQNDALFPFADIEKKRSAYIDFKDLITNPKLTTEWNNFQEEILEDSEFCLKCMSLAMHQTLLKKFQNTTDDAEQIQGYNSFVSNVRVRIFNVEPILALKNLKTNYYGTKMLRFDFYTALLLEFMLRA